VAALIKEATFKNDCVTTLMAALMMLHNIVYGMMNLLLMPIFAAFI
jgi:hypothetical protein